MKRIAITLLLILVVTFAVLVFAQIQSQTGYFSPVYSPGGKDVYFITRETNGLVTGLGIEFFTPPAHVFVWKDRFSLRKINLESGGVSVLKTWPPSPLEGEHIRTYRGRAFSVVSTQLRWVESKHLEYKIRLRIPAQPAAEQYFVSRIWNNETNQLVEKDQWHQNWVTISGDDVSPLSGDWEVIAVRGKERFPCAIVEYNSSSGEVRVLQQNDICDQIYPDGISKTHVADLARRPDIERIQELKDTHARLMREALAAGMKEHEAALHVIDQMQDLGYYRKPPQLIARLLSEGELQTLRQQQRLEPLFRITEMQFTVGLFQDIEKAVNHPGRHVDKSMGKYVIHRDYTTSQEINAFLESGGSQFYVEHQGRIFELKIEKK